MRGLALGAGGKLLATVGGDRIVRVWDIAIYRQTGRPMNATADHSLLFLRSNASGSAATQVSASSGVLGVAFTPDGNTLATAGTSSGARLWNVATRRQIGPVVVAGGQRLGVNDVAFSPDGKILTTADGDGTARLWSIPRRHQIGSAMTASESGGAA